MIAIAVLCSCVGAIIGILATALYYERKEKEDSPETNWKPTLEKRPRLNFSNPLDPIRPELTKRTPEVFQKGMIREGDDE